MNKTLIFLNKWGILIILTLVLLTFFDTCGVKTHVERLEKKITSLEQKTNSNDSLNRVISSIEREISILETSREVVYTNNAIIRTTKRPDDVMNDYNQRIKSLQEKRDKLNVTRK